VQNLERAYTNFFQKRADFPKFKKKGQREEFPSFRKASRSTTGTDVSKSRRWLDALPQVQDGAW